MSVFRQLAEKPWLDGQRRIDDHHGGGEFALPKAKVGLRMFFAVVSILFFLMVVAYGDRMALEDWRPTPQQWLLWVNTTMLAVASVGMQWARVAARRGQIYNLIAGFGVGGVFALAFVVGQFAAWQQLGALPIFDIANPAVAFFYLITALHGLHILGGLVAWARTAGKVWQGYDATQVRLSVELCAVYWHFLLLIWLILFGLLFSGNDNLGFILTICGIR